MRERKKEERGRKKERCVSVWENCKPELKKKPKKTHECFGRKENNKKIECKVKCDTVTPTTTVPVWLAKINTGEREREIRVRRKKIFFTDNNKTSSYMI